MGWDISLVDPKEGCVKVESHVQGSIYMLGGNEYAEMGVTYNYSKFYKDALDKEKGFRWLHGKKGKECVKRLKEATKKLGTDFSGDYWEPTPGNAGVILDTLKKWAEEHPKAVFDIS